ncbi:MAG: hypothetical protein V4525_03945 [Pseudomonadota bacterium]
MAKSIRHLAAVLGIITTISMGLSGCASLLPTAKEDTKTLWHSYSEAHEMYKKIVPGQTSLNELKTMGIDPAVTSNVSLLGEADMLRRLLVAFPSDIRLLDKNLRECMSSQHECFAYEIEQNHRDRKRTGNVLLDLFNFKRHTDVSGWQFDTIFVIGDGIVIYKQWSGKPNIQQSEDESNPLGPFQNMAPSLIKR